MSGLLLLGLLAWTPQLLLAETPLVILSETCYYFLNMQDILQQLGNASLVQFLPSQDLCDNPHKLFEILSQSTKRPIIGSIESDYCSTAHFAANFYNTTFTSWNCPKTGHSEEIDGAFPESRLSPSIGTITEACSSVVTSMKWKSVAIISSKSGWWPLLAQEVDIKLRENGIVPKHFLSIGQKDSFSKINSTLAVLKKNPSKVILVCMPSDGSGRQVLTLIDTLQLAQDHNALIMLLDVSSLPSWQHVFINETLQHDKNISNTLATDEISSATKNNLLLFSDLGFFNTSVESSVVKWIRMALFGFTKEPTFLLSDLHENTSFRNLLTITRDNTSAFVTQKLENNLDEWFFKHAVLDECDNCDSVNISRALTVILILGCSCLFVTILLGVAAIARTQLVKNKKIAKGPYKVLLTATDFVFPQISDGRRVDEGIEAMLCCWLQQLQEFGGPEVDKPDLIQGSGPSIRTPIRGGSSPNLAKQVIIDPRVRYNGDLVQMKPVNTGSVSVEIKTKTVELLLLLHGLRHENLNPLIGCLAEPPHAALVSEYCARGSLQDVLQQDDIKLDWSFRLSLLTDLVRGMRYLHSTPIRVHGCLTSRNCVIDSRWVLKITDYGLPSFYEAQGIASPAKTARELLWTSPELLRHNNLRKKGSQSGDVYSFGIIMQEVVVRGEPFCMLALTPEEIIEKVKRPPPLIRPSVSKGAAPPEAINIMRQCWAEQAEMRPDFNMVHDQFKKLNHGRKVNIVDTMFQMLEKYSNNLEELIRERTEQLDIEKKKTEQLLNRMLPSSVAEKLKFGMPVDPEEFDDVTIYFSDIVGFTTISAHSTPFQVVDLLNELYTCFDATINAYNVYKVETIGDAYMVVGGLPVRVADHAEQIATMALDLLHQSGKFRIRHLPGTPLRLRIGLHTGPCCSGVVGLTMPRYCLFGDTVNTASRMESTGSAWRIHLSEATKNHLEKAGGYQLEYRGPTEIKGKGTMQTYWLLGKSGFDKVLPVPPSLEESHGLDESLIISKMESYEKEIRDDLKVPQAGEDGPKSPRNKPSFIRTMEISKFASLVSKTQDDGTTIIERPEFHMTKSTSSDMATPVSASEVAAALLGASSSSLCGFRRHRKIEEEDLSTPYNHYRCLSPKQKVGKLLRRQFSLDRSDEHHRAGDEGRRMSPKLCKQNSAGAADLEKIEEIPLRIPTTSPISASPTTIQCPLSISVDSLIH